MATYEKVYFFSPPSDSNILVPADSVFYYPYLEMDCEEDFNWIESIWNYVGQTVVDNLAHIPVVGILKNSDKAGSLCKGASKSYYPESKNKPLSENYVKKVKVPKGTTIYVETMAKQIINVGAGVFSGGGDQVYIKK